MHGSNKADAVASLASHNTSLIEALNEGPESSQPQSTSEDDIFVAAQYGDWQRIERLIVQEKASANDKNEQGISPLHWAAINDRLLACKTLLDHGADVNCVGGDLKATPMMWAAKNGHTYIVHLLMTYGGDPALTDNQGYNVLQLATHSSNILLLVYLLLVDMAVDNMDPYGHTCLMWAAYQGDALSVDALLKWGASINVVDHDGLNALHWAVVRGNRQCIKRIIEDGGDLSSKQKEGKTPRVLAIELKTIISFEAALEMVGRDSETGLMASHWLSKATSMKLIYLIPFVYIGTVIQLFALAPVMIALPVNAVMIYGLQRMATSILTPPNMRSLGIHKTPYLAGIFSGSGFWTMAHWAFVIVPSIGYLHPWLNCAFGMIFATCLLEFFVALSKDPGFIPLNGVSRTEQREAVEALLRAGQFDSKHFCIDCVLRKPLRSKHCKICQRCIAKHDHHCPWINNCVGLRNHKDFVVYIVALFAGIPLYSYLVYLHTVHKGMLKNPVECTLLSTSYCHWVQVDGFGLLLAFWDCLQMTWVTMLVIVQLWQISTAMTTQEVINMRRKGSITSRNDSRRLPVTARIASALAPQGADPGITSADSDSQGPSDDRVGHSHIQSRAGVGCLRSVSRLLGVDQFIDAAKEGLTDRRKRRTLRFDNPFDGGVRSNCADFWSTQPVTEVNSQGAGRIKHTPVDFYKLYQFTAGNQEMYSRLSQSEEV